MGRCRRNDRLFICYRDLRYQLWHRIFWDNVIITIVIEYIAFFDNVSRYRKIGFSAVQRGRRSDFSLRIRVCYTVVAVMIEICDAVFKIICSDIIKMYKMYFAVLYRLSVIIFPSTIIADLSATLPLALLPNISCLLTVFM